MKLFTTCLGRTYPGSEFVEANILAKLIMLGPNEQDYRLKPFVDRLSC